MTEPELLQRQREALGAFRDAAARRTKVETDAESQRKTNHEATDSNLNEVHEAASTKLAEAHRAFEQTKVLLEKVGLQYELEQIQPAPPTLNFGGDSVKELDGSVSIAKIAANAIQADVEALQRWREAAASRRRLLAVFAIVIAIVLAGAGVLSGVFLYRSWQSEQLYQSAVAALEAEEWEKARAELQQLATVNSNYKDAKTLLIESYYRPAVAAIEAQDWQVAQENLIAAWRLDPTYEDIGGLLLKAIFRGRETRRVDLQGKEDFYANTRMEVQSIEFFVNGVIRLNVRVVVGAGDSAAISSPDRVYMQISGESIEASSFGGIFGTGSKPESVTLGGKGDAKYGWIQFAGVLDRFVSTKCFIFHYGSNYTFSDVCVEATNVPVVSPTLTQGPSSPATPIANSTSTLGPANGQVIAPSLNVRSGPGTEFGTVDKLQKGDSFNVLGKTTNSRNELWLMIGIGTDGKQKWVTGSRSYVSYSGIDDVALVEGPPTPTVPPTPFAPSTPVPKYQVVINGCNGPYGSGTSYYTIEGTVYEEGRKIGGKVVVVSKDPTSYEPGQQTWTGYDTLIYSAAMSSGTWFVWIEENSRRVSDVGSIIIGSSCPHGIVDFRFPR